MSNFYYVHAQTNQSAINVADELRLRYGGHVIAMERMCDVCESKITNEDNILECACKTCNAKFDVCKKCQDGGVKTDVCPTTYELGCTNKRN